MESEAAGAAAGAAALGPGGPVGRIDAIGYIAIFFKILTKFCIFADKYLTNKNNNYHYRHTGGECRMYG
jgi:hypothetical protein